MKRKMLSIATFFPLVFLAFSVFAVQSKRAEDAFRRGQAFEKAQKPDSALACFTLAIQADPGFVQAHAAYQDLAVRKFGREAEIWDRYERLAEENPQNPAYQVLYVSLFENNMKKIEKALDITEKNPGFSWGFSLLGRAYQDYSSMDYTDEAVEAYENAFRLDSTNVETCERLADLYSRNEDFSKSKRFALKAMALDPSRTDLLSDVWLSEYESAANLDKAKASLIKKMDGILKEHVGDLPTMYAVGDVFRELDGDRFRKLQTDMARLDPMGKAAEQQALANVYTPEKDLRKALNKGKAFLAQFPGSASSTRLFTRILQLYPKVAGIHDNEVDSLAREELKRNPNRFALYSAWYTYYAEKDSFPAGRVGPVINGWLAVSSRPHKAAPLTAMGRLLIAENRFQEAMAPLLESQTLRDKYSNPSAENNRWLGEACEKLGDMDKALEYYGQSLGLKDNPAVLEKFRAVYAGRYGSLDGSEKTLRQKMLASSALEDPYPVPDFTLPAVEGRGISFLSLRGKVVLVAIWSPG